MFKMPVHNLELPAIVVPLKPTSVENAWRGQRYTIRLIADLPAFRVHSRGSGAAAYQERFSRSGTVGKWFAIGDVILTRQEYTSAHALPSSFSHQDEWLLPSGSILNVGICAPLFNHCGGALQAEWIEGPSAKKMRLEGYWSNKAGNA